MIVESLSWIAVGLILFTSIALLISHTWRRSLIFLVLQYLGMFWLVNLHWPIAMSVVKLVTGWMAAAALAISQPELGDSTEEGRSWPQGRFFRLLTAGLVLIGIIATAPTVTSWLPGTGYQETLGALLLIGLGLLHLGVTTLPLRTILGLLTVLAGFETLYAAVENSVLVAALLAIVNLGLAMVGAYLLTPPPSEEKSL